MREAENQKLMQLPKAPSLTLALGKQGKAHRHDWKEKEEERLRGRERKWLSKHQEEEEELHCMRQLWGRRGV